MGLKLPKIPRQVQEMGLKPMDNTPKPGLEPFIKCADELLYYAQAKMVATIKRAEALAIARGLDGEALALAKHEAVSAALNTCGERFCDLSNKGSKYFPFCSWDCKDFAEQITRRK